VSDSLNTVAERWPALAAWLRAAPSVTSTWVAEVPRRVLSIAGVQLEGAFEPEAEAACQARLVPTGATAATVYGFAQGTLARTLLRRDALRRLRVVILNPSVARESLRRIDHEDWLGDERVELVRGGECRELEMPFAAAPACLRLAADEAARLRDQIRLELATPHLRRNLRDREQGLQANLEANLELVARDGDVAELFGSLAGATVRIAAAGPSLSDHFERLRDGAAPLVAVDAALGPLVRAGIVPDVVVSVDAHEEGPQRLLDLPAASLTGCVLVYFPVVAHATLRAWPGRRLAAYPPGGLCDALRARVARGELFSSGSVIHPTVDLAVRMGARRIELYGADFAIPRGQSHVSGSAWEFEYEVGPSTPWVLNEAGARVPSLANLVGYLRDLERYLATQAEVTFVNMSRTGAAIAGAPFATAGAGEFHAV